jgi:hypothetical protein
MRNYDTLITKYFDRPLKEILVTGPDWGRATRAVARDAKIYKTLRHD